jgi:hypothetical protein
MIDSVNIGLMMYSYRSKTLIVAMILSISLWIGQNSSLAMALPVGESNSSPTLYGLSIYDGELADSGHSWAGYGKSCERNTYTLSFRIENLIGGMNANLDLAEGSRYAIGFIKMENGSLATYLFKESDHDALEDLFSGRSVISTSAKGSKIADTESQNKQAEYDVDIIFNRGNIKVFVCAAGEDEGADPVIDYYDPSPLSPGAIDFENLEGSSVQLRSVLLDCSSAEDEEKPPELGEGYFEHTD